MNKVILMGRLTKDPEVRYSSGSDQLAVARYILAVNRRYKRQGEAEADFMNCVAFGKTAEFATKYFKKGQMISVIGRVQVRSWDDRDGKKRWTTEVVVEEQYFAESRSASASLNHCDESRTSVQKTADGGIDGFYPIDESVEDDLPF